MIRGRFRLGGEITEVIIRGNSLMFVHDGTMTTIEGIKLSKPGCIKQFPDLKNNPDWNKIAKERFKKYIKKFKTEIEKINYVKKELTKHGYEPMDYQIAGFRPRKL